MADAAGTGDVTAEKVDSAAAPSGAMGQKYLATGDAVAMRLWQQQPANDPPSLVARDYETVGYVVSGRAELVLDGSTVPLGPGDAWVVPRGAEHTYRILEALTAVEATAPPAHAQGDAPAS